MRLKPFVRVCSLCGLKENKNKLIMLKKENNEIVLGEKTGSGKSIYLCKACVEKLDNPKNMNKAFRMNVKPDNAEKLIKQLKEI